MPSQPGQQACSARWHLQHHKRKILRVTNALNLLRDSHRAASMCITKPLIPRTGRISCAHFRRNKYRQHGHEHQRHNDVSTSHISDESIRESFSGISTGRYRSSEGPMPDEPALYGRPMPCRVGQHIWAGCLRVAARLALEEAMRSLYRSLYLRIPSRCTSTEAEGIAEAAARGEPETEP